MVNLPCTITLPAGPVAVFMKKRFSVPSVSFVLILAADALLQPPAVRLTVVCAASRWRRSKTAWSSFIVGVGGFC